MRHGGVQSPLGNAACSRGWADRQTDRHTHTHTHTHRRRASHSWARPRGAQLTARYTVNTYSIIHSALARLAWRAYARGLYSRRCRASAGLRTPATPARHTFSGLAALCRMPKTKSIGRPVPEIWRNLARTDRHTDTTYQPDSRPFCQYPAVRWEIAR